MVAKKTTSAKRHQSSQTTGRSDVQLKSLLKILQSQIDDIQDFLDHVLAEAVSITNSKLGYIFKFSEEKEEFILHAWSADAIAECRIEDPQTCYELKNTGFWGEAVRQRKPLLENNFSSDNDLKKGYPAGHVEIKRYLTVPVFIENKIVAVAGVANKQDEYTETDMLHLQILMDSIWKIVELKQALPLRDHQLLKEKFKERLDISEKRYADIVELMTHGLAIHEAIYDEAGRMVDYRFLDMNKSFEIVTGLKRENIIGKRVLEVLPQTESYWIERYDDVVQSGKSIHFEDFSKELNKYYEVVAFRNNTDQFTVIVNDITERKKNEQYQQIQYNIAHVCASTSDFRKMFSVTETELKKVLHQSEFLFRSYNKEKEEFTIFFDEHTIDHETEALSAKQVLAGLVVEEGKTVNLRRQEIEELISTGKYDLKGELPQNWAGVAVKVADQIIGVLVARTFAEGEDYSGSTIDLLEIVGSQLSLYLTRLEIEKALKKHESLFKLIVDQVADNITVISLDLRITFCSPSILKMRGYTVEEVLTHKMEDIFTPGSLKTLMDHFHKEMLIEAGQGADPNRSLVLELQEYHKNGSLIWAEVTISFLRDENQKAIGFVVISRDITEKRKVLQELFHAKEKAEESDRLKTAFLANMSHEVRTPMNGILGFMELLKNPTLTYDKQLQIIEVVENSGRRLLNLLSDLIDISRIESGQLDLEYNDIDVEEELHKLALLYSREAIAKGISIKLDIEEEQERVLLKTDKDKFISIICNLLNNAIKFTNEGSVTFGYTIHKEELRFYVRDTGIGVPTDKQDIIFERFIQADDSFTRGYEGAGLGLSISKAYVEMLGGKIWVESAGENGALFQFTHPLITEDYARNTNTSAFRTKDHAIKSDFRPALKVLVAEDDRVSSHYISIIIKDFISEMTIVESGLEAVEFIKANPDYDLVLMDIKMIGMDGLEATRKIRQFNDKIVIIAQTAYALSGDRESTLEAGCNDYMSKPISKSTIISKLKKYF